MKLVGVREEDAEDAEDGRADGGRWLAVFTTEGSSPKEIKSLQHFIITNFSNELDKWRKNNQTNQYYI